MVATFSRHAALTIVTMAFMGILVTYVETMITPALPTLARDFSSSYDTLSWVITAYILSGTVSAAIFGRLADMYGKKRIFVILSIVYSLAITLGGFAQNLVEFVAVRAVQGLGMGMFPVAFALLNDQVAKKDLALAQGVLSSTFTGGAAIGLVVGAWITQNFGWQWSYHSAIPMAYGLTILSATVLHDHAEKNQESIDFIGVGMLSAGLVAFIMGISEAQYWGWISPPIVTSFLLSTVMFLGFIYTETKVTHPFISIRLLKIRNVFLANFAGLFAMAAMFFLFFTVPPLLQDPSPAGFGETVLASGISMLPSALASMIFAPLAAWVTKNRGPKMSILVGNFIIFLAYVGLYFNRGSALAVTEDAAILGTGMSFLFVGIINILLLSTPNREAGASTGMNVVFRNIGSSVAPAIGGLLESTFVQNVLVGYLPGRTGNLPFVPIFYAFPSRLAFSYVYEVGMVFLLVSIVFSLAMKSVSVTASSGS